MTTHHIYSFMIAAVLFQIVSSAPSCIAGESPQTALDKVKNGYFDFDNSRTIGDALEQYQHFSLVQWMPTRDKQGKQLVTVSCLFDDTIVESFRESFQEFGKIDWNPNKKLKRELELFGALDSAGILIHFAVDPNGAFSLHAANYWFKTRQGLTDGAAVTLDDIKNIYRKEPMHIKFGSQLDDILLFYYTLKYQK